MPQQRNTALLFIFFTMLLDVMGLGLIIPVMPKLMSELTGQPVNDAAVQGGWLMFVYAIAQFFCSPVIGALSDRFGRRPVLIASLVGMALDYAFMAWAPTIIWLFLGRILSGVAGASFTTANAYIADVSPPEKRAQNFGLVGAAFGLGFILGPLLGGLLGDFGTRVPFMVAGGLALLNALFGFLVLPESLAPSLRRPFEWARANPFGALRQVLRYRFLATLLLALLFTYLAGQVHPSTWSYFTAKQFQWGSREIGFSLAFVGLSIGLVQGLLVRVLVPKLGERRAVLLGLVLNIFGFVLFSMANQGWMMYAIMVPFALGGISGPSLQSLLSQQVSPSEQGELQGAQTSLVSVAEIIGPLVATYLFAWFSGASAPVYYPGAAFLAAALLSGVALLVVVWSFRKNS